MVSRPGSVRNRADGARLACRRPALEHTPILGDGKPGRGAGGLHRREGPSQPWRRASRPSRILARASDLGRTGRQHPPDPRRPGERRAHGLRADGGTGPPRPAHRGGTAAVRRRATANWGPAMTRHLAILVAAGGLVVLAAVTVWRETASGVHGVI